MGRPSKNAFQGGSRLVDMSKSSSANIQPRGGMTPETYRTMKAEKQNRFAKRQEDKQARKGKK